MSTETVTPTFVDTNRPPSFPVHAAAAVELEFVELLVAEVAAVGLEDVGVADEFEELVELDVTVVGFAGVGGAV